MCISDLEMKVEMIRTSEGDREEAIREYLHEKAGLEKLSKIIDLNNHDNANMEELGQLTRSFLDYAFEDHAKHLLGERF